MSEMKFKSLHAEININETKMVIDGMFSVAGNIDLYDDVMLPGAFKKTISHRRKHWEFFHVNDHNYRFHIADILEVDDTEGGGYFKSQFYEREREIFEGVKDGTFNGMSFAFFELKSKRELNDGVMINYIEEVDLVEISSTRWPVNPLAQSSAAKGLTREMFFEFASRLSEEDTATLKGLLNAPDPIIKTNIDLSAWSEKLKALI